MIAEERDKKNRLYPLTLFRKKPAILAAEVENPVQASTPAVSLSKIKPKENVLASWPDVPSTIADDANVCANLARTYPKEGMTDLERYHAKFGDVGTKAMKRAMPELSVPKKF